MKPALCKLLLKYYDTAEAWRWAMFILALRPDKKSNRRVESLAQKLSVLSVRIDKMREDTK
ncbi:MAG: hypothetical protein IMZ62_12850 [Chloroflexi bacterium]|nr:hypothetical protein [Chloroflexota bacterium]MBE3119092.1 hypothetical protein [Candidatus Atribacteria bacterium]